MSSEFPYSRVSVTGASGFIASWIVKNLLERGVQVHGTVRSLQAEEKISHLRAMQEQYPGLLTLFEADLMVSGSFDEALSGCDALIHSASPFFISNIKDAEAELIKPAKQGTLNVLRSAQKSGTIKRIVLTSSVAAVHVDNNEWKDSEAGILDERCWNQRSDVSYQPYSYSKTLAEKAAWDFSDSMENTSLVVINPAFVMGPPLSDRKDSTSTDTIMRFFSGELKYGVPDLYYGMVDVRDVALAHIRALENREASGRFIVSADTISFPQMAEVMQQAFAGRLPVKAKALPKLLFYLWGPMLGFSWRYTRNNYGIPLKLSNKRSVDILGMQYRPVRDSLVEHARALIGKGLVKLS